MKINYFDFGLHKGDEILMFLEAIEPLTKDVNVYGFEAHTELAKEAENRYKDYPNVTIINKAIAERNSKVRLYIAEGNKMEGNSIFKTKNNVDPENFIDVDGIKFSDWIKKNVPNYKKSINVIRFNIEGAEIYLMHDIVKAGINKHISLYLGSKGGDDILKCTEIKHLHKVYMEHLDKFNIDIHQFCKASPNNIPYDKIRELIQNA